MLWFMLIYGTFFITLASCMPAPHSTIQERGFVSDICTAFRPPPAALPALNIEVSQIINQNIIPGNLPLLSELPLTTWSEGDDNHRVEFRAWRNPTAENARSFYAFVEVQVTGPANLLIQLTGTSEANPATGAPGFYQHTADTASGSGASRFPRRRVVFLNVPFNAENVEYKLTGNWANL
ncbi:hypothetical protein IAQ61_011540 [Plenodomus lingam]|uniref:Predicted protein n=1 Tax=Leptosphaeria maculans (strain JN3 / isolate v23.1.3 / race Av1-4-5-6-7-8) TaxID=985895 RepID=E5AAD7_LEPMJ|nr:predicted protein [Plenodomus lingam JN3]KAH9859759.1 hypothetical protein IAQ61_011540 [Plenodomus lingam]CBY00628.1 predicted protein [Plenodomus lingam JN3]